MISSKNLKINLLLQKSPLFLHNSGLLIVTCYAFRFVLLQDKELAPPPRPLSDHPLWCEKGKWCCGSHGDRERSIMWCNPWHVHCKFWIYWRERSVVYGIESCFYWIPETGTFELQRTTPACSSKVSYLENQPIISIQACKKGYWLLALCIKMDPPWHLFF